MFENMLPSTKREGRLPSRSSDVLDMMDRLWRVPFSAVSGLTPSTPVVDVSETDEDIRIKAELPGLEAKDVEVTLLDEALTLKGEKKQETEEKQENYVRVERSYGSFSRVIPLPSRIIRDKASAKFENGVLTVRMPKAEKGPSEQATRIKIE